jgi:predicted nucleic acid-binding protein
MIVLDANILIRAVLGRHVRQLFETYAGHGIRFYAPETAYADASKYLPSLLRKKGMSNASVQRTTLYGTVAPSFVIPPAPACRGSS